MSKKQEDNAAKLIVITVIGAVVYLSTLSSEVLTILNVISFIFIVCVIGAFAAYFYLKKTGKNKPASEPTSTSRAKKSVPVPLAKVPLADEQKNDDMNRKNLLTETEARFKQFLKSNLPRNIEIHSKTRLVDRLPFEVNIREGSRREKLEKRRVLMMHIDFTLVHSETSEVLPAIELDDGTHNTKDAQKRDALKNRWLKEGGIKIIRIPAADCYTGKVLQGIISHCCKK